MVSPSLVVYRTLEGTSSLMQQEICSQLYCLGDQSPGEDPTLQERTEEAGKWALTHCLTQALSLGEGGCTLEVGPGLWEGGALIVSIYVTCGIHVIQIKECYLGLLVTNLT